MAADIDMRTIGKEGCLERHFSWADQCIPVRTKLKRAGGDSDACAAITEETGTPYKDRVAKCKAFKMPDKKTGEMLKVCRWDKRCYFS